MRKKDSKVADSVCVNPTSATEYAATEYAATIDLSRPMNCYGLTPEYPYGVSPFCNRMRFAVMVCHVKSDTFGEPLNTIFAPTFDHPFHNGDLHVQHSRL